MHLDDLLRAALDEDIGPGDLATESTLPPDAAGRAVIRAKESLIVSGQGPARRVLELAAERYDGRIDFVSLVPDGTRVENGTERGLLAQPPRRQSIERVRDPRGEEDPQGEAWRPAQQRQGNRGYRQ